MKKSRKRNAISLVIGVIARSKAGKKRGEAEEIVRAHGFRCGLSHAFLQARSRISPSEIPSFLENAARLTTFEINRFSSRPVGYAHLAALQEVPPRSLKFEITWLSERLRQEAERLNLFIAKKEEIERLVLGSDFVEALKSIIALDSEFGASLWSTSLRVAVLQEIGGDDAQKQFTSEIRKQYKKAILPYYLRFLSQRAESTVPIGWYIENVKRRLASNPDNDIRTYLVHKLTGEWPSLPKDIATILRVEQNHHIFDIYETFVGALQHLAIESNPSPIGQAAKRAFERMVSIRDFRLEKLSIGFGCDVQLRACPIFDASGCNLLLSGRIRDAYVRELCLDRTTDCSIASTLTLSLIQSVDVRSRKVLPRFQRRLEFQMAAGLSPVLATRFEPKESQTVERAKKAGHVFGALPYATALRGLELALEASTVENQFKWLRLAALNSPNISYLDPIANAPTPSVARYYLALLPESDSKELSKIFLDADHRSDVTLDIPARSYAASCACHFSSRYADAGRLAEVALTSKSRVLSSISAIVALSAYAANSSYSAATSLISREISFRRRTADSLPIAPVFAGASWSDLAPSAEDISMSNALAAFQEIDASDNTRSNRVFALQKVLRKLAVERPSQLKDIDCQGRHEEFVYFLNKACSTDVLDMLRVIPSSRAVLEERRDIAALLAQLDPEHQDEYRYQVLSLSKEIRISQGLQTIDASRIHVDIPAIRSILRRDLGDSFNRYLQLTKDGQTSIETFDSLLRDLLKPDIAAKLWLSGPESEADELLFTMIRQARDRFLFNVPHGLDSYLSKRVRHGSIVSFLRVPAESEGMITQQHADGRYKENTRWGRAIATSRSPLELQKAFLSFSRSFDQHLLRLKDVLLHVRSEEKPLGLFDLRILAVQYRLIRVVASTDRTLDGFLETMLSSLRGLLNPSLQAARNQMLHETSRHLDRLFSELRLSVQAQMPFGPDRTDLLAAVNRSSAAVQSAVTAVAGWFTPIEIGDHRFTLEEICEISAASVESLTPSFVPKITFQDETGLIFSVKELPFMQDIFFIALGNTAKWSNLSEPAVDIVANYDREAGVLSLEIVNDVSFLGGMEEASARIEAAKPHRHDPCYLERARSEGQSGIPKLAAVAYQSEYGALDIGITGEGRFRLAISLSVTTGESNEDTHS